MRSHTCDVSIFKAFPLRSEAVSKYSSSPRRILSQQSMTTESTHPKPLPGILHVYDPEKRLVCFESGRTSSTTSSATSPSKNCVIFVGGLGDGLAAIPVLPELSHALHSIEEGGWSLIQVLTRSSYLGWTIGEVDRDVKDLITLEAYLRRQAGKTGKLVLMGHSTGRWNTTILFINHVFTPDLERRFFPCLLSMSSQAARILYDSSNCMDRQQPTTLASSKHL